MLEQMGAVITRGDRYIEASLSAGKVLKGITLDCTKIPDAAMTLVPMALKTEGPVRLTGIASWRVKETDRIAAMAAEMNKFGVRVESGPDWIEVERGATVEENVEVATYDDHRMAMSFSLAAAAGVPVVIKDPGCTAKTYPAYFDEFFRIIGKRN